MKMQIKTDGKQATLTLRGTLEEVSDAMDKITKGTKLEDENGRQASSDIN